MTGEIPFKVAKLEDLINRAVREIALLAGYRKKVRWRGSPDIEAKIAEARHQVELLEEERAERADCGEVK